VKALGGRLGGLGRRVDERENKSLKIKGGRGLFIEQTPVHLRSNFDFDLLLGLYLGLNLIWFDLRLDVNFKVVVSVRFAIDLRVEFELRVRSTWESGLTLESKWLRSQF